MASPPTGIYPGAVLAQGAGRELVEQQRGSDVPRREVSDLGIREHDVGRVRRVIETDQVPDFVERYDPDIVRRERPAARVERGERHYTVHEMAVLVPGEVRLTGALHLELDLPIEAHLGGRRVRVQPESHGHARLLPALERLAHAVEEARLEVRGRPGAEEHPHRGEDAVVPAVQHRIATLRD